MQEFNHCSAVPWDPSISLGKVLIDHGDHVMIVSKDPNVMDKVCETEIQEAKKKWGVYF